MPARLVADIHATTSGRLTAIDGARMGEIARRAGAPAEKAAGVDLLVSVGTIVQIGDTLFRIHANDEGDLGAAMAMAAQATGCMIDRLNPA